MPSNNAIIAALQGKSNTFNKHEIANAPCFAAVLTPYRSLDKNGFVLLMALISFSCLLSGLFFLLAGAWPVMIAMGVDVIAIWLAFKLSYRQARAYEEVLVWRDKIIVRKVSPSGKSSENFFNPLWVRFWIERRENVGIASIKLRQADQELELGSFLNPDDRHSFATAFSAALADVRR